MAAMVAARGPPSSSSDRTASRMASLVCFRSGAIWNIRPSSGRPWDMEHLSYIDEHAIRIDAPRGWVWKGLQGYVDAFLRSAEHSALGGLLGAHPRAGFAVDGVEPEHRLSLAGRHRFSRYELVFELGETRDGGTQLRAQTYADFPGAAWSALSCAGDRHARTRVGDQSHLALGEAPDPGLTPALNPTRYECNSRRADSAARARWKLRTNPT